MFRFLRKHKTITMIFLAAVFVGMIFFGVGGPSFQASPRDVIVKINGEKIYQERYDLLYNQMLRNREDMSVEERKRFPQEVFQELIRQVVFQQEAKRYGIHITDDEVLLYLASVPLFQKDGKFDWPTYTRTVIQGFRMPPDKFEEFRKIDLADRKLRQLIASAIYISDDVLNEALANRLAVETDKEKKRELKENPEILRNEILREELNLVFNDWLNQLNSRLKVAVVSEAFKKRLSGEG